MKSDSKILLWHNRLSECHKGIVTRDWILIQEQTLVTILLLAKKPTKEYYFYKDIATNI